MPVETFLSDSVAPLHTGPYPDLVRVVGEKLGLWWEPEEEVRSPPCALVSPPAPALRPPLPRPFIAVRRRWPLIFILLHARIC